MTLEQKKKIMRYLKENKAYDMYRYYLNFPEKYGTATTRAQFKTTEEFLDTIEYTRSINCAFYWMITKEGDPFWRKLSTNIIYNFG